ncbi:MAG: lipoprotein NlpD, partial [Cyanobacteriota bacterium]
MKDVLTPQTTLLIPSPLSASANGGFSPLTPIQQGQRLARRSAAMVGLAFSMGATSFLFAPTATATDSSNLSSLASLNDLSAESTPNPENKDQLAAPSVKYKVQAGESLWEIGQTFQVPPSAIAAANQIKGDTNLSAGQSLTIPNLPASARASTPQSVAALPTVVDPTTVSVPTPHNVTAVDSVNSLGTPASSTVLVPPRALTAANPSVVKPEAQAAIADVSRPIQVIPAEDQGASTSIENTAKGVGIDVTPTRAIATPAQVTAAAYGDEPVSILVTPPEEFRPVEVDENNEPSPLSNPQSSPLPDVPEMVAVPYKTQKDDPLSGESVSLDTLRRNGMALPAQPQETALNAPIAIPVMPPAAEVPMAKALPNEPPTVLAPEPSAITPTFQPGPQVAPDSEAYQVKSGDTLNHIARLHNLDPAELKRVNGLNNANRIKVDQVLTIPAPQAVALAPDESTVPALPVPSSTATVDSEPELQYQEQLKAEVTQLNQGQPVAMPQPLVVASTPTSLDKAPDWEQPKPLPADFNQPRQDLAQLQRQYSPQVERTKFSTSPSQIIGAAPSPVQDYNNSLQTPVGQEVSPELPPLNTPDFPKGPSQFTGYSWPAKGVLTSGYGRRWGRMHRGIDIAGPIGTPIVAAASGEVISAGWNAGGFGKLVKIRHADGSITYYAHNNRILVRKGDYVQQGQQVAEMGSTGRSTGPHLHFEIRPDGKSAINP